MSYLGCILIAPFHTLDPIMTTDQIRNSLQVMHKDRGRLAAFAEANQLNYNLLIKFMTNPGRQLWHDNAQAIINALPPEFKIINVAEQGAA